MTHIKLVDENTDLSNLKRPVGWDLEVRGVPYDVYRVDGYNHTIGGRFGDNCYWACPEGETPTYENLIEFSGDAPTWGIAFDRVNYIKNKWDETSVEANGSCWITRNGKKFYRVPARFLDYGLAKAQYILVQLLEESPLSLALRNWEKEAVGRKIYYQGEPAIITRITNDLELMVVPDGIEKFSKPFHWSADMDWDEYQDGLMVELLSPSIYWFRD